MMHSISIFGYEIAPSLAIPIFYFLWVTILLYLKRYCFRSLKNFTEKTKTMIDDILINSLDFPLTLIIFTSGGAIIESLIPSPEEIELTNYFLIGFKATTILAIILFADKFLDSIIKNYSSKVDILRATGGIARGFIRVIVLGLGLLILLDSFGVSITPLLASLGVGSLAVALALQPTLENFFSGVQIMVDKPFAMGHFIKLETGEEGYIHRIGWRSTWIRLLPNNVIVIPNKLLVNSRVLNYYYPEQEMAVLVQVGVHYDSDLEKVEKVTIEVAKETLKTVPGGIAEFEPFIRYHTFDAYSINFSVILRAKEFVDNYLVKHEFIKNLHKRYAKEGIIIPYPIRAINYAQEKSQEG